jgi:NADH:ubiquinone oxidoreductase subunit 6 (subunit J)
MKAASSLPRKTIVLETGFVSKGTIVPLSNSLEMLFMAVISANRNMPMAGIVKVTAYSGFALMGWSVVALMTTGKTQDKVANTNATMMVPMNFFLRMFQSISYLTIAQKRVSQLGRVLPRFVVVTAVSLPDPC